jgi:acetylornithine aminotransferase
MPVSRVLREQSTYPFVRLSAAAAARREQGLEVIDLGMGDPREPTDKAIIKALKDGVRDRMGYPAAAGLPELREAVATWVGRRFGVALDPDRHVVPTLGSKEAIFSFAQVVLDIEAGRDTVIVSEPGYPVPGRGATFAGGSVLELPLLERNGWLPDIDAVTAFDWKRAALVWVNYPNNPTGATAPLSFFRRLAELAREHRFVVASDEAYTELWVDEPPVSALQLEDWSNVVVFNTLSKRSSMTGFRSGFVAGDPLLVDALKKFRPNIGTAPQEFVQRASVVAWSDEEHVVRARETYARKRAVFTDLFRRHGIRVAGGTATMYVWFAVPDGETSEEFADRLLGHGVIVTPGSFLGRSGEGYARIALVPTEDECARAAELLDVALAGGAEPAGDG